LSYVHPIARYLYMIISDLTFFMLFSCLMYNVGMGVIVLYK